MTGDADDARPTPSQWHHVVLVRDGVAKEIRGYENGTLGLDRDLHRRSPATSTYNVNIGRNPGGGQHFKGLRGRGADLQPRPETGGDPGALRGGRRSAASRHAGADDAGKPERDRRSRPRRSTCPGRPRATIAASRATASIETALRSAPRRRPSFRDSGLAPSTTYSYTVAAYDGAGNLSPQSSPVTATTPATTPQPQQREDTTITNGLTNPTSMGMAPDGRIFVAEQGGKLRVVKNGVLLPTPFLTRPRDVEQRARAARRHLRPELRAEPVRLRLLHLASSPVVNRVSRFTASSANPDVAEPGSEVFIFDNIPSKTGLAQRRRDPLRRRRPALRGRRRGSQRQQRPVARHRLREAAADQRGREHPDRQPLLHHGDRPDTARSGRWACATRSRSTSSRAPAGSSSTTWARTRARRSTRPGSARTTGSNAGFNFGWPATEGPHTDPRYKTPFHSYPQASGDCAITGGSFYDPATVNFPAEYVGDYFFADYCAGWIKSIDLATKAVTTFITADGTRDPVDLKVAADGSLYYLAPRHERRAPRVRYVGAGQPPSIAQPSAEHDRRRSAAARPSASARPAHRPLAYQWQRNGVEHRRARPAPSYTRLERRSRRQRGAVPRGVTNAYGSATSKPATLTVTTNQPPTAAIGQPARRDALRGRRHDHVLGLGHRPEDGDVARERLHLEGGLPPRVAHAPVHPGHARQHGRLVHGPHHRPHGRGRLVPDLPDRAATAAA